MPMQTVVAEVAGVRSPVRVAGPEGPEAVVFVHGNPGSGADWEYLQGRISEFARTAAPDMPGYVGADKPRDFDYSVEGYARHLGGVIRELGIERAHLVLHDFGAPWGLEWVLQEPDSVASLTLIGNGVFRGYTWHHWARMWRLPVIGPLIQYTTPRQVAVMATKRENPGLTKEQVDRLSRQISPFGTRRAILAAYRATPQERYDFRDGRGRQQPLIPLFAELDLPALVLWPTEDVYIPYQPETQREAFPSARIEILEGLSHWPHWEAPERVADLIVPFLQEQVATPSAAG
jgi:pimeloyl-ACP methyl ester carboxylesterase